MIVEKRSIMAVMMALGVVHTELSRMQKDVGKITINDIGRLLNAIDGMGNVLAWEMRSAGVSQQEMMEGAMKEFQEALL